LLYLKVFWRADKIIKNYCRLLFYKKKLMQTRILHIIPTLEQGGAETLLAYIVNNANKKKFQHIVITLFDVENFYQNSISPYKSIKARGYFDLLIKLPRLYSAVKQISPDVIQTWMYHANLLGSILCLFGFQILWSVHNTTLDLVNSKRLTRIANYVCSKLSNLQSINTVYCSRETQLYHQRLGYKTQRSVVINNSIDYNLFKPSKLLREEIRNELSIKGDQFLIGHIARFDPQKDHSTFFNAVGIVRKEKQDVRVLLCGQDVCSQNAALMSLIRENNLEDFCYLLSVRQDVNRIMNGLDLLVVSSAYGEAFPMVILEAMGCCLPVVATDLGEVRAILDKYGSVVPTRNASALADSILDVYSNLKEQPNMHGEVYRQYALKKFGFEKMLNEYNDLYKQISAN
jgi:glycosyltransferase involved in cell wall biosynthesis